MSSAPSGEKRRRTKAASEGFSFNTLLKAIFGVFLTIGGAALVVFPNIVIKPMVDYAKAWITKVDKAADESLAQKERLARLEDDMKRQREIIVIREPSEAGNASRRTETAPLPEPMPPAPSQITAILRQPQNAPRQGAEPAIQPPPLPSLDFPPPPPQPLRPVEPVRGPLALSAHQCVAIPAARGTLVIVRSGDRICSPDGLKVARVLIATPSRVAFAFNGREFSCRPGETCSFDWAYAPLFQISETSAQDAQSGVLILQ